MTDLSLSSTLKLVGTLYNIPNADKYIFDFCEAHSFEPISLLYLSSEIRNLRDRKSYSAFSVVNYRSCTYAAHMGFFQAFGADYGKFPGQANGSSSYLPLQIFTVSNMKTEAAERMQPVGEFIEVLMKNLTKILVNDTTSHVYGVLAYSLREIFRNVIEHSESNQFGFCAQYWPAQKKASVAILDKGIGIKSSLSLNPHLKLDTDLDAIKQALLPGISGKMFKGKRINHYDVWQNSGYGLHMTSEICKMGGSFLIASGNAGMIINEDGETPIGLSIQGTLINLTIDTSQVIDVEEMLYKISKRVKDRKVKIKPSKASVGFSKD